MSKALTAFFLLSFFIQSSAWSADEYVNVTLDYNLNVRINKGGQLVRKSGSNRVLRKGSVIQVKKSELDNPKNWTARLMSGSTAKYPYIGNFEVVSSPGMGSAEIEEINGLDAYVSYRLSALSAGIKPTPKSEIPFASGNATSPSRARVLSEAGNIAKAIETINDTLPKHTSSPDNCHKEKFEKISEPEPPPPPPPKPVLDSSLDQRCIFLVKEPMKYHNCLKLFEEAKVPREALEYALAYFDANRNGLKDSRCLDDAKIRPAKGLTRDNLRRGIQNQCQILINNVTEKWKGFPNRSTAYYIDLCEENPKKVVKRFYMNRGTGKGYVDINDRKTTVPGAFLTASETYSFTPYNWTTKYEQYRMRHGHPKGLRMVGIHESNNDTSYSKPLHESPYESSHGCPSSGPHFRKIMKELAKNGPSLVINYVDNRRNPPESVYNCRAGL